MDLLYPKRVTPATMNEKDLARLLVIWPVAIAADGYHNDDRPLRAIAKRLKVEVKAIEKQVRAELTAGAQLKATKKGAKK